MGHEALWRCVEDPTNYS